MSKIKVSGHAFEKIICELIKRNNKLTITQTRATGDGGIDFFCTTIGNILAGEIKTGATVGTPNIRNFIGSMSTYKINHGLFITTNTISKDASQLIKSLGSEFAFLAVRVSSTKIPKALTLSETVLSAEMNKSNSSILRFDRSTKSIFFNDQIL